MEKKLASFEDRLHTELWTSWASLLRSYAGAHGLNTRHQCVVEVGTEEILLRVDNRWTRFTQNAMTTSEDGVFRFALAEDGSVELDGRIEEMDFAAERIAREMMYQ